MTDRIRFALLFLVVVGCVTPRVGGALGATNTVDRPIVHAVSHATAVAHKQAKIVRYARHFLGTPYVYGGASPGSGFDCSGFTRFVYAHFGIALPHYSGAQFAMGRRVSRVGLRPGDLVFFNGLGHEGSAPPAQPSANPSPALASGSSQRAAFIATLRTTPPGAFPTTRPSPSPAREAALPS